MGIRLHLIPPASAPTPRSLLLHHQASLHASCSLNKCRSHWLENSLFCLLPFRFLQCNSTDFQRRQLSKLMRLEAHRAAHLGCSTTCSDMHAHHVPKSASTNTISSTASPRFQARLVGCGAGFAVALLTAAGLLVIFPFLPVAAAERPRQAAHARPARARTVLFFCLALLLLLLLPSHSF